ncbi:MAG: hypothetical protein ABJE47_05590 [bacterium]
MRTTFLIAVGVCAVASSARAQAPAAGPLALLLPASARATALGNAWVAARDESAIFYNPAQLVPTNGIGGSFARYGANGSSGALTSAVTIGTLTYGWGVQVVDFTASTAAAYPFMPADLIQRGSRNALSLVAAAGANYVFKGFRTGASLKYAEDRVDASPSAGQPAILHGLLLGDFGASHPLWSGTAALSVQNVGDHSNVRLPLQTSLGWTRQKQVGDFDVGLVTQVSERNKWLGAAGGVEAGYGWIEGWSFVARAGAHRPESQAQRPLTLGGGLNADRLVLDYALEFFEHERYAHHISIRWR